MGRKRTDSDQNSLEPKSVIQKHKQAEGDGKTTGPTENVYSAANSEDSVPLQNRRRATNRRKIDSSSDEGLLKKPGSAIVRQTKVVLEESESFEISSADLAISDDEEYKSPPNKTLTRDASNRNSMPMPKPTGQKRLPQKEAPQA